MQAQIMQNATNAIEANDPMNIEQNNTSDKENENPENVKNTRE